MKSLIRALAAIALMSASLAAAAASPQQNPTSLTGSWSATIGARPALQGTWSAKLRSTAPNSATGTWALVNGQGRILLKGTWSATRTVGAWSGAWSARASTGAARSGTWRANAEHSQDTFADLLRSTLEKQLTGAWSSAGVNGTWALMADARDRNRR